MKRKIINLIFVMCIVVFLGSGAYLAKYFLEADQAEKQIRELIEIKEEGINEEKEFPESEDSGVLNKYIRLHEKNKDLVGWVSVAGTEIDYPVMQNSRDAEYYLHRNFEKKMDKNGLPILDINCDIKESGSNFIIYGHHMKSGMMFAGLLKYAEKDFYNEHKEVCFDTIYEEGKYRIFSAFYTEVPETERDFDFSVFSGKMEKEKFDKYVENVTELSLFDTGIKPVCGQTLITLVTCSYHTEDGRFIVAAVKE